MALKESYASVPSRQRKERTEKYLNKNNIRINPQLPVIEDENVRVKSPEETLKRAVAALFAAQVAMDCVNFEADISESAEFFEENIKRFGIEDELTPDERKFLALADPEAERPSEDEAKKVSSRIEMVIALFWACGIIGGEQEYPSRAGNFIEAARTVVACESFDELRRRASMRTDAEILDNADLFYRMNWACRDAKEKGEEPSGRLDALVVRQRHKGLCWLISLKGAENWDEIVLPK